MKKVLVRFYHFLVIGMKDPGFVRGWLVISAACSLMLLLFSDWTLPIVALACLLGMLVASVVMFLIGAAASAFIASTRS